MVLIPGVRSAFVVWGMILSKIGSRRVEFSWVGPSSGTSCDLAGTHQKSRLFLTEKMACAARTPTFRWKAKCPTPCNGCSPMVETSGWGKCRTKLRVEPRTRSHADPAAENRPGTSSYLSLIIEPRKNHGHYPDDRFEHRRGSKHQYSCRCRHRDRCLNRWRYCGRFG